MGDQSKIIIDELRILDYFDDLKTAESNILMWTKIADGTGRKLFFSHISFSNLVDHEVGLINHNPDEPFSQFCEEGAAIFTYAEEDSMLFKTTIKRFHGDLMVLDFPKKISIVADEMKLSIHKTIESLDPNLKKIKKAEKGLKKKDEYGIEIETPEDQEKYSKLRSSPRGKAMSGQQAKIQVRKLQRVIGTSIHEVFDISRGGMSVLSKSPHELEVGLHIEVLEVNGDPPPFPLAGEIVSIRRIDLKEVKYRVGIKFG